MSNFLDAKMYNFKLGTIETYSAQYIEDGKTIVRIQPYRSVYELQKSAEEWLWCDFSWFTDELKYRQYFYNNSVPIYKLPKQ